MKFDFPEPLKVVIIGVIEGVTEWLPVSSTGHMLIFDAFIPLKAGEAFKETFFVVIQLGAIVAVPIAFWEKLFPIGFSGGKPRIKSDAVGAWIKVAVACVPAGVAGLLLDDFLAARFGNAVTVSATLILYGAAFIVIENYNKNRAPKINAVAGIDLKTAFNIGCFQALSLVPGTSRSGAAITGALLLGVSRPAAAEFSFFLAVPIMAAASLYKLLKFGLCFAPEEIIFLALGTAVAFLVSLSAIKFLVNYVKRRDFKVFGAYRIILGLIVLLVCAATEGKNA